MRTTAPGIRRGAAALALTCVGALGLGACGVSAQNVPLPGGADVGDNPLHVTLRFADVLDLVPQGTVKVNGLLAGRVTGVSLAEDGWTAQVDAEIRGDVDLPANATAAIQQTNLLGEKFIMLSAPEGEPAHGHLADGAVLDTARTRTATDIEQVLGALSLLLNGGGVDQIQPVVEQLEAMTSGRETQLRTTLESANRLVGSLDRQRDSIVAALDGVNTLSSRARDQQEQIRAVLDELPAGVAVLNEQRPQFTEMLRKIDDAGQVGSDILLRSRTDLIADLRALRPLLQNLAKSTPALIDISGHVPTFPFPDAAVDSAKGSSANVFLSIDGRISEALDNLGVNRGTPVTPMPKSTRGPYNVDPKNPYVGGNGPDKRTTVVLPLLPVPAIMDKAVVPDPAPGGPPIGPWLGEEQQGAGR